jgi:predicted RNA-binding protein with EMAP domain
LISGYAASRVRSVLGATSTLDVALHKRLEEHKGYFEKHVGELQNAAQRALLRHRGDIIDRQLVLERLAAMAIEMGRSERITHPATVSATLQKLSHAVAHTADKAVPLAGIEHQLRAIERWAQHCRVRHLAAHAAADTDRFFDLDNTTGLVAMNRTGGTADHTYRVGAVHARLRELQTAVSNPVADKPWVAVVPCGARADTIVAPCAAVQVDHHRLLAVKKAVLNDELHPPGMIDPVSGLGIDLLGGLKSRGCRGERRGLVSRKAPPLARSTRSGVDKIAHRFG